MRRTKKARRVILAVMPVWIFFLLVLQVLGQSPGPGVAASPGDLRAGDQSQESALFFKAKESLFKLDWDAAKSGLEQYLRDYPSGSLAAEALYWYANCLNKISRFENDIDRVISLKEEAILILNDLIERFKQESWALEGAVLRSKFSRDLWVLGRPEFSDTIRPHIVPSKERTREFLRPDWLTSAVAQLTPEAAFPVLLRLGRSDPDPQVRSRAHFLLAQDYRTIALPELQAVSMTDPDKDVCREATLLIERVQMSEIPVTLVSYVFFARLSNRSGGKAIKEGIVNLVELPHGMPGEENARAAIRGLWGDVILEIPRGVREPEVAPEYFGALSESSPRAAGFNINFINSDFKKEPSKISGMLRVRDATARRALVQAFSVDLGRDQIMAVRNGDQAAFILFQFEHRGEIPSDSKNPLRNSYLKTEAEARESLGSSTTLILGLSVRSARSFWPIDGEGSTGSSGIRDLGFAKVDMPGAGGTWTLQGHILCDKKARSFIGRQFTLTDPQGKIVASGARIEVPAASPQAYRIEGRSTAIVFAPELKNLRERMIFEAGKFHDFEVGRALADALASAVMNVDKTASIRDSDPASGGFNRIFKFSIDRTKSGLGRLGEDHVGGMTKYDVGSEEFGDLSALRNRQKTQQRYALAVKVEILDGRTMKPMRSEVIEGRGAYNRQWPATFAAGSASPMTGGGAELEAKKLQKACDDAIAQVLKSFTKMLKDLR